MALQHSPSIVTSGLVLCVDAANPRSYPGSGTTWYDASGNGNTGTLSNGPVYTSGINGYFTFDGVDDLATFPSTTSTNISTTITASVWVYYISGNGRIFQKDGPASTRCWEIGGYAGTLRMGEAVYRGEAWQGAAGRGGERTRDAWEGCPWRAGPD